MRPFVIILISLVYIVVELCRIKLQKMFVILFGLRNDPNIILLHKQIWEGNSRNVHEEWAFFPCLAKPNNLW